MKKYTNFYSIDVKTMIYSEANYFNCKIDKQH